MCLPSFVRARVHAARVDDFTAVPRWYGTTAFRSSMEADWARALDGWGMEWAYEPAAIKLPGV